jgi:hypothetical protein
MSAHAGPVGNPICGRCGHSVQGEQCIIYGAGDYLLGQTGTAERRASALITARRPADMALQDGCLAGW